MCFIHKWTKWEQYVENGTYFMPKTGDKVPFTEKRQRRTCTKCGKMEDELVV